MKTNRRYLTGGLTAIALAAVVTGTALAQSGPPAPADSTAPATTTAPDDEANEGPEQDEDDEAPLNGSITATEDESLSEADEAAQLAQTPGLISEADAIAAATADGGTADTAELENENGSVVYEVEVTATDGTVEEVKVDAGNGDVLAREADDHEGDDHEGDHEGDEGSEADEANEAPEAGETAETTTP